MYLKKTFGFALVARPLNVADNYEIVKGIPAFVWKPSENYDPFYHNYAISADGTRFAIQKGWSKIW